MGSNNRKKIYKNIYFWILSKIQRETDFSIEEIALHLVRSPMTVLIDDDFLVLLSNAGDILMEPLWMYTYEKSYH